MKTIDFEQGSPEWKAHRKTTHNASDYPSAQGLSKKFTRTALIEESATGIEREFSPFMEKILENGHLVEISGRAMAEEIIGEDLFPLVATTDDGYLGASSDGATMDGSTGWECKQWNEELAASVAAGVVPDTHVGQLDQQGEVFGFKRILFMVTDGTPAKCVYCWHEPSAEAKAAIRPTWRQFDEDVAAYVPTEKAAPLVAEVVKDLPAVMVQVSGSLSVANNFKLFEAAARDFIEHRLIREPKTDQDFVDLDAQIKSMKKAEDALDSAESSMLSQVSAVDEAKKTKDMLKKLIRDNRLAAEKLLTEKKESIKRSIVVCGQEALRQYVASLNDRIGGFMPEVSADFGAAIKGLRSLDSMNNEVNTLLANKKIEASAIADRIEANIKSLTINGESWRFLFPDLHIVASKQSDDFSALLASRKANHKEAEEKRLQRERERIREEEQYLANKRAMDAVEAEKAERQETKQAVSDVINKSFESSACLSTIKLGDICAAIGFTVTADFLASLGIIPITTEKNAKLYDVNALPTICRLLIEHLNRVMQKSLGGIAT